MMQLPFTNEAFFDLFAAYNAACWAGVAALWSASAIAFVVSLSPRRSYDRWIGPLLAVLWAWSAVAYHVMFFTRINPAAWLFAAVFLLQAALFVWSGRTHPGLSLRSAHTLWTRFGALLIVYALAYPFINLFERGDAMRIPTFGLPCPTTIFTAGVLLRASSPPKMLAIIPIVWSAIGGSAAFLLGVRADLALPVAGAALVLFSLRKPEMFSNAASAIARVYGAFVTGFRQ